VNKGLSHYLLHTQAMANGEPEDLQGLVGYSREHPEQDMVIMYPEILNGAMSRAA